jgi:hypothetical protein
MTTRGSSARAWPTARQLLRASFPLSNLIWFNSIRLHTIEWYYQVLYMLLCCPARGSGGGGGGSGREQGSGEARSQWVQRLDSGAIDLLSSH